VSKKSPFAASVIGPDPVRFPEAFTLSSSVLTGISSFDDTPLLSGRKNGLDFERLPQFQPLFEILSDILFVLSIEGRIHFHREKT